MTPKGAIPEIAKAEAIDRFFDLCRALHKSNYEYMSIMWRSFEKHHTSLV
jgi:hypothetical protein